jgi:IS5 family transposase
VTTPGCFEVVPLFKELFPFGGQLEEDNRWLRIADLIPWRELEREYNTHFSHLGRPETDGRLFLGLIPRKERFLTRERG